MSQSNLYSTGYKATALVGSTTFAYAKAIVLPAGKADVVKVKTLNGLQVIPDGRSDFGRVTLTVPQDAATPTTNTYSDTIVSTIVVTFSNNYTTGLNGAVFTANNAYCVSDSMGTVTRGSTVDRVMEFELTSDGSWTTS